MILTREHLFGIKKLIEKLKKESFSVSTQYKFLKLNKIIAAEEEILIEQRELLLKDYAELDKNGDYIILEDGGVKIKEDMIQKCLLKIQEINLMSITLPEIYFSLDELEDLNLTLEELSLLEPFIK